VSRGQGRSGYVVDQNWSEADVSVEQHLERVERRRRFGDSQFDATYPKSYSSTRPYSPPSW